MAMDPLYDSDSHEEKPARVSRPRRWAELVNRKLSGNQSRNDERQVTNSPTSYSERMQVMGSPPSVLPKRKPLEPETSKPLPNPHANSPRSVEEATQEEEYDTGVENAGDPNENERTDSKFDGEPTDDNLEEKLQKSQAELREAKQQIEQLNSDITDLREILTNKSSKSFQAPMQLPLHCPESDIINSWHALDYGVRNLVVNHFKGSKESKMLAWTRRQEDYLRDLTPHYTEVATDSKCATAFIEAAIWYALCTSTFGPDAPNAPFFWAGKYKRNMATMNDQLLSDVRRLKSSQQRTMFYQWKALTANLISGTIAEEDRKRENNAITDDINEMLDGLTSSLTPWAHRTELRAIVNRAVDLGMRLCAQQKRYRIGWTVKKRYNVELDDHTMRLSPGSPDTTRVRFIVRPGLFEEDYDGLRVIDYCRVWAH